MFGVNGPDGTRARSTTLMLLVRRPPSWLETWISFCLATRVLSRFRMFSTSIWRRVVEDGVLVHPDDVAPLRVEEALERALLVQGGAVVGFGGADGLADLLLERVLGGCRAGP